MKTTAGQNNAIPRQSLMAPIAIMREQGVPFSSLIDIGCADGTFSLECLDMFGRNLTVFNIDPQPVYEPSLQEIRQKVGGHYKITAVSSFNGRTRFAINAKSPYWSKTSDDGDFVDCRTLDSLLQEFAVPSPYLIKMDIEGAEFAALQGAVAILDQAAALVLETDVYYGAASGGNFLDIYTFLAARNFSLFDLCGLGYRSGDQVLYQVYTTFLNKRYEFRHKESEAASQAAEDRLASTMTWRREALLARNKEIMLRWDMASGRDGPG
jgi:FkbM family methyltransferase